MLADHQPAHQGERAKVCSKCHQAKPLDEFWRDTTKRDGRCAACIACRDALYSRGESARAYRAANRDAIAARNRAYHAANAEKVRARQAARRAAAKATATT